MAMSCLAMLLGGLPTRTHPSQLRLSRFGEIGEINLGVWNMLHALAGSLAGR